MSSFYVPWCLLLLVQVAIVSVHTQECPYGGPSRYLVSDSHAVLRADCGSNNSRLRWTPPEQNVQSVFVYSSCINVTKVNSSDEVLNARTLEFDRSFGSTDPSSLELRMVDGAPVPTSVDQVCLYFGCYRRKDFFQRSTFITFATVLCTYREDSTNSPTTVIPSPTLSLSNKQTQVSSLDTPSISFSTSLPSPIRMTTSLLMVTGTNSKSLETTIATTRTTIKADSSSAPFSSTIFSPTPSAISSIRTVSLLVVVTVSVVLPILILVTVLMTATLCYIFIKREKKFSFSDHVLPLKRPFKTEDKLCNIDPIDVHLPPKTLTLSEPTLCDKLELSENIKSDGQFVASFQLDTHFGPSIEDLHQMYNKMVGVTDPNAQLDEAIMMESPDTSDPLSAPMSGVNKMFHHWQYNWSRESGEYIEIDISSPLSPTVETYDDAWAGITTYAIEQEGAPPRSDTNLTCEDCETAVSENKVESINDGDGCTSSASDSRSSERNNSSEDNSNEDHSSDDNSRDELLNRDEVILHSPKES